MARKFILAEYCEGPFYMGWWLYERDRNDGSENDDGWDRWGWLVRRGGGYAAVENLVRSLGHSDYPPLHPQPAPNDRFAGWFAGKFPGGILVDAEGDAYRAVQVIPGPPPQIHRNVIRTVGRAGRSFRRACAARGGP